MIFLSQQIEGIEAMLDEQADQEQVDNSSLSPNKKDHGLKIENTQKVNEVMVLDLHVNNVTILDQRSFRTNSMDFVLSPLKGFF